MASSRASLLWEKISRHIFGEDAATRMVSRKPLAHPAKRRQADIAVLCLPIPTIREFLKRYAASMKQTLVTDIGSVKGCIVKTAQEQKVRFIGGHPMAGTEFSGPEAMVPGIYEKATVFIVPPRGASDADIEAVARMWQAVKAKPMILTPKAHDQLVAHTKRIYDLMFFRPRSDFRTPSPADPAVSASVQGRAQTAPQHSQPDNCYCLFHIFSVTV